MGEELNLNQLKQERMNVLLRIGEEAHKLVRNGDQEINEAIKQASQSMRDIDIKIGQLSGSFNYTLDKCPKCGNAIEQGVAFCGSCGFSIRDYENQFTAKCNICGARIGEGQTFCEICGTKLK